MARVPTPEDSEKIKLCLDFGGVKFESRDVAICMRPVISNAKLVTLMVEDPNTGARLFEISAVREEWIRIMDENSETDQKKISWNRIPLWIKGKCTKLVEDPNKQKGNKQ